MAYQDIPGSTAGVLSPAAATTLTKAQSVLGTSVNKIWGLDFDTTAGTAITAVSGGAATLSTTERDGVINCSTSGTANSSALVRPAGSGALIINPTTERWFVRFRARLTTGIDANAEISVGVAGFANPGFFLGGNGVRSTTNFTYDFYNNSGTGTNSGSLGVALDTNFHLYDIWGDTVNFYVALDNVIALTLAIPASYTNACSTRIDAVNGATAANRQINVDYQYICTA